jgi:hypothetical protein
MEMTGCARTKECSDITAGSTRSVEPELHPSGSKPNVVLTDADIGALVDRLEGMKNRRTLELAFDIGRLVTEGLYGGDPAAHRRRGTQDAAYRRLVGHPRLSLSPSTVWRSLGVYELCMRMPGILKCTELKARHVYAVLSLEPAEQELLLSAAARERWPVEKLEAEASSHRSAGGRGRPRHTPLRRAATLLVRFLELDVSIGATLAVDLRRRADTIELLRKVRQKCDELERLLTDADRGFGVSRVATHLKERQVPVVRRPGASVQ